jgi:uncharacterized protein YbjT (DUF2867 family)
MAIRILSLGSTGRVGRPFTPALLACSAEIRALVREGRAVAGTLPLAVEQVVGDLTDDAALKGMLRGADTRRSPRAAAGALDAGERGHLGTVAA